jgi:hypothetical protein
MAVNLGPRMTEGIDSRQIRRVNSNIHPVELNGGGKLIIWSCCLVEVLTFAAYFRFWYLDYC